MAERACLLAAAKRLLTREHACSARCDDNFAPHHRGEIAGANRHKIVGIPTEPEQASTSNECNHELPARASMPTAALRPHSSRIYCACVVMGPSLDELPAYSKNTQITAQHTQLDDDHHLIGQHFPLHVERQRRQQGNQEKDHRRLRPSIGCDRERIGFLHPRSRGITRAFAVRHPGAGTDVRQQFVGGRHHRWVRRQRNRGGIGGHTAFVAGCCAPIDNAIKKNTNFAITFMVFSLFVVSLLFCENQK